MLLDLREVIFVLSGVLDFVGVSDVQHGKRVAFMAHAMGQALGFTRYQQGRLFEAALLHDAGVSTTREHCELVTTYTVPNAHWHCNRGADLLASCAPLASLAPIVAEHHTPWCRLTESSETPDPWDRLAANIIHLADRVDVMLTRNRDSDPALLRDTILTTLQKRVGEQYAPEVLEAFRAASARQAFWFALEPEALHLELAPLAREGRYTSLSLPVLIDLASVFARIVDAKSPFTATHSAAVGKISACLGAKVGLNDDQVCQLQIAGLLHDIGKLRIPDAILDKAGPLDTDERATMNRHAYYTQCILRQIDGFSDIALWAGSHHETLEGGGYPYGRNAAELPLQARIIAVADIFQALAQNRPYRDAMPLPDILDIIGRLVRQRKLDGDVAGLLISEAPMFQAVCDRASLRPA